MAVIPSRASRRKIVRSRITCQTLPPTASQEYGRTEPRASSMLLTTSLQPTNSQRVKRREKRENNNRDWTHWGAKRQRKMHPICGQCTACNSSVRLYSSSGQRYTMFSSTRQTVLSSATGAVLLKVSPSTLVQPHADADAPVPILL